MGLFQCALETYDANQSIAGMYEDGKEPLAPIGHAIVSANIEITIDQDGKYISSAQRSKEEKIIIPVTESSAGRSGTKLSPHPLCEQIKYLASYDDKSEERQQDYLTQLKNWIESDFGDPKLEAIYKYVSANTIVEDLCKDGNLKLTDKGLPSKEEELVAWNVLGCEGEARVYRDVKLMSLYSKYYLDKIQEKCDKNICMLTGEEVILASQHLKGIFSSKGNAKLISSNDKTNFTFRGRFINPKDALTIGYLASQKSHNALKWVLKNQGTVQGGRAFVCWSPQGDQIPVPINPLVKSDDQNRTKMVPSDYRDMLSRTIEGYRSELKDKISSKTVVAVFDAAIPGRLAVTFYSEIPTEIYLMRLKDWDEHCVWYSFNTVLAPSIPRIVQYTYGLERNREHDGHVEVDDNIKKQTVERLLRCRIGKELFPADIEKQLVQNASRMHLYGKTTRKYLLDTTCAVIRKYYYDHKKEEIGMELDMEKPDRSYQFGRLLAIYEKIERDTYDKSDEREPNAIRLQSVFCNRPLHYAFELEKQLERAYIPRLPAGSRINYKNMIGEIMSIINAFPENEINKPLSDMYLIGYYLQRKNMYTKKDNVADE